MARIAVLTSELINQIAAGEVVERPASVVKELGENALDAGARAIRVRVEGGGIDHISVVDDGHGMSREDATLCVLRHATSKLRSAEGLEAIETLGFRGEALAAIAAVSRFRLVTLDPSAQVGTRVELEGGEGLRIMDSAAAPGTEIHVDDLFFNTPARRKFLRRPETELRYVEEALVQLALPNPDVAFRLESEGKVRLAIPAGASAHERLVAVVGARVDPHLVELRADRLGIRVRGVIALPELTLSNARQLHTFVNGRSVRDRGLNAAISRGFGGALPPGRQPVAAIFIEVDPHAVDVNVHPRKLEVRFRDGRSIQEALSAAIAEALREAHRNTQPENPPMEAAHYARAVDRFLSQARPEGWGLLAEATGNFPSPSGFGFVRPELEAAKPPGWFGALRFVGTLGDRFWLCEAQGKSLAVLDRHAVVERVARGRLQRSFEAGSASPRPAESDLFSGTVDISASEAELLGTRLETLAALGIDLEPFGGGTFSVRRLPASLAEADLRSLLVELTEVTAPGSEAPTARALEVMACHAATSNPRMPAHAEVMGLLKELDAVEIELRCIHAQVVVLEVPYLELERRTRAKN